MTVCHKGGIICISEVIDTSPCSFDSSLCFIQPSVPPDVLCIEVKCRVHLAASTTPTYYLTVYIGEKSGYFVMGLSVQHLTWLKSRCWACWLSSHLRLRTFHAHYLLAEFLCGCMTGLTIFFLAVGKAFSLPYHMSYRHFHVMTFCFHPGKQE